MKKFKTISNFSRKLKRLNIHLYKQRNHEKKYDGMEKSHS